MNKSASQPQALLGWMGSLSDPTRLRLLRLLDRHELGVVELCDVLQLPQSTISRHLKVLADQGWLRSSRQGTAHLYRMTLDELDAPRRRLWLLAREQIESWATILQDELRLARRLREKQSEAQAFFAGAAAQWDRLREESYGHEFARSAMLSLLPSDCVLADLGCGTGQIAAEAGKYVGRVIGVDNSPAMLRAARKRTAQIPNVEIRPGDLEALPIEDATCDAAMLILVLTYIMQPPAAVGEARRILKPGGKIIIVDLLPHDREDFRRHMGQRCKGFQLEQVNDFLHAANLDPLVARPLAPSPQARGPALFLAVGQKKGTPRH